MAMMGLIADFLENRSRFMLELLIVMHRYADFALSEVVDSSIPTTCTV